MVGQPVVEVVVVHAVRGVRIPEVGAVHDTEYLVTENLTESWSG